MVAIILLSVQKEGWNRHADGDEGKKKKILPTELEVRRQYIMSSLYFTRTTLLNVSELIGTPYLAMTFPAKDQMHSELEAEDGAKYFLAMMQAVSVPFQQGVLSTSQVPYHHGTIRDGSKK